MEYRTEIRGVTLIQFRRQNYLAMDFVGGLPKMRGVKDMIWVVVDHLTKSKHFLQVKKSDNTDFLSRLYVRETVRIYGAPTSIGSDRDSIFVS